jgi:hypothetical protein
MVAGLVTMGARRIVSCSTGYHRYLIHDPQMVLMKWGAVDITAVVVVVFLEIRSNMTPREKGIYSCHVCKNNSTFGSTSCTI